MFQKQFLIGFKKVFSCSRSTMLYQSTTVLSQMGLALELQSLKKKDVVSCALFALIRAHLPDPELVDKMLQVVESFVERLFQSAKPLPRGAQTLLAFFFLGVRKSKRKLSHELEVKLVETLKKYCSSCESDNDTATLAVLSLLSIEDPNDMLAALCQTKLRREMKSLIQRGDLPRAAFSIFGASPFLDPDDITVTLNSILATMCTDSSRFWSVEEMSFFLLAAHFARHRMPQLANAVRQCVAPHLVSTLLSADISSSSSSTPLYSSYRKPEASNMRIPRWPLVLVSLYQSGNVSPIPYLDIKISNKEPCHAR